MSTPRQFLREYLQNCAAKAHSRHEPLPERVRWVLTPILDRYEHDRDKSFFKRIVKEFVAAKQHDQTKSVALWAQEAELLLQKYLRGSDRAPRTCVAVGKLILDDAHFNNQIWPKAERVREFFRRLSLLASARFCMDATVESMADLLHGECLLQPNTEDGDPFYLVRNIPTDIVLLISEYYARKLSRDLLQNPTRGFSILQQWMHYHVHGGEKPLTFTEFFNDEDNLLTFIERKFQSNGIVLDWNSLDTSDYLKIIKAREELPPPSLPMFGKTSLTLEKMAEINGAIATLYSLVQYPTPLHPDIRNAWRDSETLDQIMPLKTPFRVFQLRSKAKRYSNIVSIFPEDAKLKQLASEIVHSDDRELTETIDARELALNRCLSKTQDILDYFKDLKRAVSGGRFYFVFNRLVERGKIWPIEDVIQTLAITEPDDLEFRLTPWLLSRLLWQVMTSSPATWSPALTTLVPKLVGLLRHAQAHPHLYPWMIETYPIELIEQIDWLYRSLQAGTVLLCPEVLYTPSDLSDMEFNLQAFSKEDRRRFFLALQGRGWWIQLPKNIKLTDIVEHPDDFAAILVVCSSIQREQELRKIWEVCVADPILFMIVQDMIVEQFGAIALSSLWNWSDLSCQTSGVTLPPSDQIGRRKFFSGMTEIPVARLERILSFFKETDFDEAFIARHAHAIVHFQDPLKVLKKFSRDNQRRLYAAWCLTPELSEKDSYTFMPTTKSWDIVLIREIQLAFKSMESDAKMRGLTSRVAVRQLLYREGQIDPKISSIHQRWTHHRHGWDPVVQECLDKIALTLEFDTFSDIEICKSHLESMQDCISSMPRDLAQLAQPEFVKHQDQLLESLQQETSFKGKKSQLENDILSVWIRFLDQPWSRESDRTVIADILKKIFLNFSRMGHPLCLEMKNRLLSQVSDPVWMSLRGKIAMISDYQNTVEILTLMSSDRITEMQTRLMKPSLWKTNMNDCEAHLKCEDLHWVRLEIQRYQNSPNTQIILLAVNAGLVSTLETFESLIALLSPSVDEAARTRLRESFLQAQPAETPAKNSASKKTYAEALRGMNSQRVLEPSSEILTEVNDQEGSTLKYE